MKKSRVAQVLGYFEVRFALRIDADGLEAESLTEKKFLPSQVCRTVLIENGLALSSRRKK